MAEDASSDVRALKPASVVCGVDGSEPGLTALRQARTLLGEEGRLTVVAVWDPGLAVRAGIHAGQVVGELREAARDALRAAAEVDPGAEQLLIRGAGVAGLLDTIDRERADLVAVGSHGGSRAAGIVLGSAASAMAHYAPCSVLISRAGAGEGEFPGPILHAADGSTESQDAAATAASIAAAHGSRVLTASIGEGSETAEATGLSREAIEAHGVTPEVVAEPGAPHDRLVELAASSRAGLVVIGSRGRTGLKALGSVSERVAHRAPCSVLIVRRAAHPAAQD